MKLLFWKEWKELRLMPIIATAVLLALILANAVIDRLHGQLFTFEDTYAILCFVWFIFWVAAGAGTFSPEIGSGSLQFISVLPVSRGSYWWMKVLAAFCAAAATFTLTTLVWLAVFDVSFHAELVQVIQILQVRINHEAAADVYGLITLIVITFATSFCAGLCASPFFDRTLSAGVAAFVGGIIYTAFVSHLYELTGAFRGMSRFSIGHMVINWLLLSVMGLAPLVVTSYQTFTRGESLKSSQRFKIGAIAAAGTTIISSVVLAAGMLVKIW